MSTQNHFNLIAADAALLDEAQAAEIPAIAKGALCTWRSTVRYALPVVKTGRNVRCRRSDLLARLAPALDQGQRFSCPASWRHQIPALCFGPYGHGINHGTIPQFKLNKDWA